MNSAANISPRSPRTAVVTLVAAAPPEMLDRFMRIEEVSEITGLSKATIEAFKLQQKNAEEAATKVRTFSQLMGTIKESIGSG